MRRVKEEKRRRRLLQGSFTVEAALLMPILLGVLLGVLYLCFFVHHRAWYTASALEAAVTGSTHSVRDEKTGRRVAEGKAYGNGGNGAPGLTDIKITVDTGKDNIEVCYKGRVLVPYPGLRGEFTCKGSRPVLRPTRFIRGIRKVEMYAGGL